MCKVTVPEVFQNRGDVARRDGVCGLGWGSERSLPIIMTLFTAWFLGHGGCRAGAEDQQLFTAVSEVCHNRGTQRHSKALG